jgi:hypothetical protein
MRRRFIGDMKPEIVLRCRPDEFGIVMTIFADQDFGGGGGNCHGWFDSI